VQASILPPEGTSFTSSFALSPDGTRLAFVARGDEGEVTLWVRPLAGLTAQPLAGTEGAETPFWSPDGLSLGFFAGGKLKTIGVGGGPIQALADAPSSRGGTWGPSGDIVFAPTFASGLHIISAPGGFAEPLTELDPDRGEISHRWPTFLLTGRDPRPFVRLPFDQMYAAYSGDGKWIAYQSNESGRFQIYVQPASGSGGRWQLSKDGGLYPRWNGDGTEIFYIAPPNRMMVVPVSPGEVFDAGVPRVLFQANVPLTGEPPYDVTPDGERFVVEREPNVATPITLVTNWTALVERR
jgi:hypothetical protein